MKKLTVIFFLGVLMISKGIVSMSVMRRAVVEAARAYDEIIGWNMASFLDYNPVIKLNDGYLSGLVASRDVTENAEAVKEFEGLCRSLGIRYMYINYPTKICVSQDRDISGILDFANQNSDRFLHKLREAGVRVYDFRETLHSEGMNHHEAFFRTDHHWRPETGLWAARHIMEILKKDCGWHVDPEILMPENFEHTVYSDWFLGSQGKKLTLSRTKPDDISLLYPKYDTSLHIVIPNKAVDLSGDFTVTYNMNAIKTKDLRKLSAFAAYNHGRNPLCKIDNLITSDSHKLLLIYDSFSDVVISFLALGIKNVEAIDLRQFNGSLKSYILSSKPDVVITAYYTEIPGFTSSSQQPENKLYDFR